MQGSHWHTANHRKLHCLPFIVHDVNMRNIDETLNEVVSIYVDMNATHLKVAKWKYEISNLKETIRVFENSLQSINLVVVQGCIEQVTSLNKMLCGVLQLLTYQKEVVLRDCSKM
mgnify:CR=1 FL=1